MELSDEAKDLIAKEFEALAKKTNTALQELNFYRWALRIIFALLFGGTILGVMKLQDYLDDRIQKRTEELSGIVYGSAAQSANDPRAAIEQYSGFLDKLDDATLRPSGPIRSIYYLRFLQALADDNQTDPAGEFEAKPAFVSLVESRYFKKDFLLNETRWRDDPSYLNAWGRCLVKFGESVADVESAYKWFERAAEGNSDRPADAAANYFAMAMVALARGDEDAAKALLQKAAEVSPKSHGIKKNIGKYESDLEGEYQIWERGAKKFQKPDIAGRYSRVMLSLIAEHDATSKSTTTP